MPSTKMLKHLCAIFILVSLHFSSFGQDTFSFPEDLQVDPNSPALKELKIKSIEQRVLVIEQHFTDSTEVDTSTFLQYAVTYDKSSRVASFKYDFEPEYDLSGMHPDDVKILIAYRNDSSRLMQRIKNGDTTYYNYYENIFHYSNYGTLMNVEIVSPSRMLLSRSVPVPTNAKVITTKDYYENKRVIKREVYEDDQLTRTLHFEYIEESAESRVFHLLSQLKEHTGARTYIYTFEYAFY